MGTGLLAVVTESIGKGILWRPFRKVVRVRTGTRLFELTTILVRILLSLPLTFWSEKASVLAVSILYIDDYLAGKDGDNWRKRWKTAKNKIKWRMKIVVPKPVVQ
jgi:hypothetical protein